MSELSTRSYHSPARQKAAAATRERIVDAGTQLVHGFTTWDWDELTFRAVAERAEVSERTVYRHFPTERHLHDAIMGRLEDEAGIAYEDVELGNLADVTARVFACAQAIRDQRFDRHTTRIGLRGRRDQTARRPGPRSCDRIDYRTRRNGHWPACSTCSGAQPRTNAWSARGTSRTLKPSMQSSG